MKIIFKGDGRQIPRERKKLAKKDIIHVLRSFSIPDVSATGWKIPGLHKKVLAPHGRIKNLDYAVYNTEKIDPFFIFGQLKSTTNYLVGVIKTPREDYYYLIELGEFILVGNIYQLHLPASIIVVTKRSIF